MKQVRNWRKLGVREVFEVLYSPVKAFKKIVEKPDFKGVILILVLFMSFTLVEQYVITSKLLLRTETPDEDDWTESLSNQHDWASNDSPSLDETDYKMGNTAGNHSVKSFVFNDTSIWMKVTDIGSFDCSADTGYEELFFWIKWIHENGVQSSGATLRLFSGSESSYFELDLTSFIASSDEWSNATLKIGLEQGWISTNSPDWQSITGLEFRLVWLAPANLTTKIDDLHFQKYVSFIETGTTSESIIGILMSAAVVFSMNWILWAGILLMIAKVFREEGGRWTMFFVIIGYVFIVTVVYRIVSAALFSMLPALNIPSKVWPPTTKEGINATSALIEERWYPTWAYQVYIMLHPVFIVFNMPFYFPFLREIWTMALCIIAIRSLWGITWGKAASISTVALIIRSILTFLLGI
ncbi:MAG: hypothetical protein OEZ35_08595 [Candidatus Bathyarchaeota archaeon]|nr:hypothetical protein [Candidatus Bathyarchaeota archaeon]